MHLQEGYWALQRGHELPQKVKGSLCRKACDIFAEEITDMKCREGKEEGAAEIALELGA